MALMQDKSEAFKIFFLIQFSKQLLRHSATYDISTLERILKEKTKQVIEKREKEKERNKRKLFELVEKKKSFVVENVAPVKSKKVEKFEIQRSEHIPRKIMIRQSQSLPPPIQRPNIPIGQLPFGLQHIRPTPSSEPIDIGNLTPYLNDPSVSTIECNGPETVVLIKRGREMRKTDVTLSKEEIEATLQAFSRAAKIPIHEGVYRVAVGRVILTAQISDETGSKFVISKMF